MLTKEVFDKVELAAELEEDLRTVTEWGKTWLVSFNASKTKLLSINRFKDPYLPSVLMDKVELSENSNFCLWASYFPRISHGKLILSRLPSLQL